MTKDYKCFSCQQTITFGPNKTNLNLDGSVHNCNGNGKEKAKPTLDLKVSPLLDQIHKEALFACQKYLGGLFDNAPEDKKIMYIMHYENLTMECKKLERLAREVQY